MRLQHLTTSPDTPREFAGGRTLSVFRRVHRFFVAENGAAKSAIIVAWVCGFTGLLALIAAHANSLWKDEVSYQLNIPVLERYGLSIGFLRRMTGQAGPLYTVVHAAFSPLTDRSLPGIRLVNATLLMACIILSALVLKRRGHNRLLAGTLLAVPSVYVCSGLALTELPAMTFVCLSLLLYELALASKGRFTAVCLYLFSGVIMSLAILGRQPYLVVPFIIGASRFSTARVRARAEMVVYLIGALSLPVLVFSVWHGLQPNSQVAIDHGVSLLHGCFAFGYALVIALLVAPRWLYLPGRKAMPVLAAIWVVLVAVNVFAVHAEFLPMRSVMQQVFDVGSQALVARVFYASVIYAGVYFVVSAGGRLFRGDATAYDSMYSLCAVGVLATSAAITHLFSSRYVVQAAPFIVVMLAPYVRFNWLTFGGTVVGIVSGLLSLQSFVS